MSREIIIGNLAKIAWSDIPHIPRPTKVIEQMAQFYGQCYIVIRPQLATLQIRKTRLKVNLHLSKLKL
jgi:hypothetical protein